MGTSNTVHELVGKLNNVGTELERQQRISIETAAIEAKKVTVGFMAAATGGDLMLSGLNRGGPSKKVGVNYKLETRGAGVQAFVKATGPVPLIENDVAKHYVVSKYAKGAQRISATTGKKLRSTRQSRIASVAFGAGAGGGDRRAVLHWGDNFARYTVASSKGRHPWERGINTSIPRTTEIIARGNRLALVKAMT